MHRARCAPGFGSDARWFLARGPLAIPGPQSNRTSKCTGSSPEGRPECLEGKRKVCLCQLKVAAATKKQSVAERYKAKRDNLCRATRRFPLPRKTPVAQEIGLKDRLWAWQSVPVKTAAGADWSRSGCVLAA